MQKQHSSRGRMSYARDCISSQMLCQAECVRCDVVHVRVEVADGLSRDCFCGSMIPILLTKEHGVVVT